MENNAKPKRSTIRMRLYYKRRKRCRKLLLAAIVSNSKYNRFYPRVSFLSFREFGLLDTGANISSIGGELVQTNFTNLPSFNKCRSQVKTADGQSQIVTGWLSVEIEFKGQKRPINLFIIPSITQNLILGIDFWTSFYLMPNIVESVDLIDKNFLKQATEKGFNNSLHEVESLDLNNFHSFIEPKFPLTSGQLQQLNAIVALFPNGEQQGLGRTGLIQHHIDVEDSKQIKQRFYPVSPAVEKLIFGEIDRMLALGVIGKSQSPWSSPMRLVIKPNKVRLCLDARKLNSVTKKDAYPLPSIKGIFQGCPRPTLYRSWIQKMPTGKLA